MSSRVSRKKLFFTSLLSALAVELLRLFDPVGGVFDRIIALVLGSTPGPKFARLLLEAVFLLVIGTIIFEILQHKPGDWLYDNLWLPIIDKASYYLYLLGLPPKQIYSEGERATKLFRNHLCRSLKESAHVYLLLFSGYTMVHEEEKFILEAFKQLSVTELEAKDIRILVLDPECKFWETRATAFLESKKNWRSLAEYKQLCEDARHVLSRIPCVNVATYNGTPPLWRLHIFDDYMFVSRYSEPGDPDFREGHRTEVVSIKRQNPMYNWLYSAFRSRCPDEWREKLRYTLE